MNIVKKILAALIVMFAILNIAIYFTNRTTSKVKSLDMGVAETVIDEMTEAVTQFEEVTGYSVGIVISSEQKVNFETLESKTGKMDMYLAIVYGEGSYLFNRSTADKVPCDAKVTPDNAVATAKNMLVLATNAKEYPVKNPSKLLKLSEKMDFPVKKIISVILAVLVLFTRSAGRKREAPKPPRRSNDSEIHFG